MGEPPFCLSKKKSTAIEGTCRDAVNLKCSQLVCQNLFFK
jgi:hypothetical protein